MKIIEKFGLTFIDHDNELNSKLENSTPQKKITKLNNKALKKVRSRKKMEISY
jgi:hypothetical protein